MYQLESKHLKWLYSFGKKYTEKTRKQKRQIIELIIKDWGNLYIQKLSIKDVELKLIQDKEHSNSWKNFYLETLGSVYDATLILCPKQINKPKFQKFIRQSRKPDIFNKNDLNKLLQPENFTNYTNYLIFKVIASCGLRLGEARGIKLNQLIVAKQVLIIDGFCLQDGRKTKWNKTGNEQDKKLRTVLVPEETLIELVNYISINKIEENDFIFNSNKKPLGQNYLEKEFKKALKNANILSYNKKYVPHSLRFTYITMMRTNTNVEILRKMVGHSTIKMTDYYTRAAINEMLEAVKPATEAANKLFE